MSGQSYCQNSVAVTSLSLPAVPRHCQQLIARFVRRFVRWCQGATALPLLSANLALFRVRLVAVTPASEAYAGRTSPMFGSETALEPRFFTLHGRHLLEMRATL